MSHSKNIKHHVFSKNDNCKACKIVDRIV